MASILEICESQAQLAKAFQMYKEFDKYFKLPNGFYIIQNKLNPLRNERMAEDVGEFYIRDNMNAEDLERYTKDFVTFKIITNPSWSMLNGRYEN